MFNCKPCGFRTPGNWCLRCGPTEEHRLAQAACKRKPTRFVDGFLQMDLENWNAERTRKELLKFGIDLNTAKIIG